jgi:hypothetical protein
VWWQRSISPTYAASTDEAALRDLWRVHPGGLERRSSAVGRDTISHPERGHDDVSNAVAGAASLSNRRLRHQHALGRVTTAVPLSSAFVFKPSSTAGGAFDYDGVLRALSS